MPMTQNNLNKDLTSITKNLYEYFNSRDHKKVVEFVSDQAEWKDMASGTVFRGKEGFLNFDRVWQDAFPDGIVEVTRMMPSGDQVIVEYTGRGTHKGNLVGPKGMIPPTGKTVELYLCDII